MDPERPLLRTDAFCNLVRHHGVLAAVVYIYLWTRCRVCRGTVWPSVGRIAADLGKSRRAVQLALRSLEAEGLVERLSSPGHANIYTLTIVDPDDTEIEVAVASGNGRSKGNAPWS